MAIKGKTKNETFNSYSSKVENNKAELKKGLLSHKGKQTCPRLLWALEKAAGTKRARKRSKECFCYRW